MNWVLLAALGLTGVGAAVAARRILAEKRRLHREWQRQTGGVAPSTAAGAPEKSGTRNPRAYSDMCQAMAQAGLVCRETANENARLISEATPGCGAPREPRCVRLNEAEMYAEEAYGDTVWDAAMRIGRGDLTYEEEEQLIQEQWEERMPLRGIGSYEFTTLPPSRRRR